MNAKERMEKGPCSAVHVPGGLAVGVTGGIACGKSEVGRIAREAGFAVLDADDVAREVVEPGREAHEAIVARFGRGILRPDGTVDRSALGERVFADASEREALNRIVHPPVRRRWRQWLEGMRAADRAAAVIIPLLFEVGAEDEWDAVICVAAPEAAVIERLRARGLDDEQARRRIAAQMDLDEKRNRSDHVIENAGSLADLQARTRNVLDRIHSQQEKEHQTRTKETPT